MQDYQARTGCSSEEAIAIVARDIIEETNTTKTICCDQKTENEFEFGSDTTMDVMQ